MHRDTRTHDHPLQASDLNDLLNLFLISLFSSPDESDDDATMMERENCLAVCAICWWRGNRIRQWHEYGTISPTPSIIQSAERFQWITVLIVRSTTVEQLRAEYQRWPKNSNQWQSACHSDCFSLLTTCIAYLMMQGCCCCHSLSFLQGNRLQFVHCNH